MAGGPSGPRRLRRPHRVARAAPRGRSLPAEHAGQARHTGVSAVCKAGGGGAPAHPCPTSNPPKTQRLGTGPVAHPAGGRPRRRGRRAARWPRLASLRGHLAGLLAAGSISAVLSPASADGQATRMLPPRVPAWSEPGQPAACDGASGSSERGAHAPASASRPRRCPGPGRSPRWGRRAWRLPVSSLRHAATRHAGNRPPLSEARGSRGQCHVTEGDLGPGRVSDFFAAQNEQEPAHRVRTRVGGCLGRGVEMPPPHPFSQRGPA